MKRIISAVVAVLMLLTMFAVPAFAADVTATIDAGTGKVGDIITVNVNFPANTDAAAGSFFLQYDNTKMSVVKNSAKKGAVLSNSTATVNENYDTVNKNKVFINFAGTTAVSSSAGTVLTVNFKLTADGSAEFSIGELGLVKVDTTPISCEGETKSITIEKATSVSPIIDVADCRIGDTFDVTVSLPGGSGAAYCVATLKYDKTLASYEKFTSEESFTEFIKHNKMKGTVTFDTVSEEIELSSAFASGCELFTATFTALAEGEATFTVDLELYNAGGNDIACEPASETIEISQKRFEGPVTLTITPQDGKVSDTVAVELSLPANTGAVSASFNLKYDNEMLSVISAEAGSNVGSAVVNKNYVDEKDGKKAIRLAYSSLTEIEGGVVLKATFKCLKEGEAALKVADFKLVEISKEAQLIDLETLESTESLTIGAKATRSIAISNLSTASGVSFDCTLTTDGTMAGQVIATLYDENDMPKAIKIIPAEEALKVTFDQSGEYIKVFWWNIAIMQPFAQPTVINLK